MAYEFKKIAEVEALDKVPNGANALIEVNGEVKRVPGSGLGGSGGIATAIIKSSNYDSAVAGVSTYASKPTAPPVTYSCINMTYDEARQILASGQPLAVMMMYVDGDYPCDAYAAAVVLDINFIGIAAGSRKLFWTSDGITTTQPK